MKFPDYGKCKIRSIYLAQELEKENITATVLYGIYKPLTARKTWDERWQKAVCEEFAHFWLKIDRLFYDFSAFQFGEKDRIRTLDTDERYTTLGVYNHQTGEMIHTGNLIIKWESIDEIDGVPTLAVEPVFV